MVNKINLEIIEKTSKKDLLPNLGVLINIVPALYINIYIVCVSIYSRWITNCHLFYCPFSFCCLPLFLSVIKKGKDYRIVEAQVG